MDKRISVKLILELKADGLSQNEIARTRHISKHSVGDVIRIAEEKGLTYEDVEGMSSLAIYRLFFPERMAVEQIYELPDYEYVHKELRRVGVTLKLLWQEYRDKCQKNGTVPVGKTKFCDDYGKYVASSALTNHLEHKPGERCEVDWSGPTMKFTNPDTGESITAYLFVSCLTYSRYAYVEPTLDMKMDTWLRCHIRMYHAFGGVPVRTICDNLKTGVVKHPKEGEIVLTDAYESLGTHYVTAIMPAAVRKPKQKASVENTVGNIATSIIAKLRNHKFRDFDDLRGAVAKALEDYNNAPFEKRSQSRAEVLIEERQFLRPLPIVDYEIASWERARKVYSNCHVAFRKNFYSVPYRYRGKYVDVRYTDDIVEIYHDHQRIASHPKFPDYVSNKYHTNAEDMPEHFNRPEMDDVRMRAWASTIGPNTVDVVERIFQSVQIKEQGYNSVLAVLRLSQHYSEERLEAACGIALKNTAVPRYRYLRAILSSNQDILLREREARYVPQLNHSVFDESGAFVRGAAYYGGKRHD